MVKTLNRWFPLAFVAVFLGLDFALKAWSLATLTAGQSQPFIPGLISWVLTFNAGAAWGLFGGQPWFLIAIRLGVGLALLVYLFRNPTKPLFTVALALIAGGALGNGLDKLWDGTVVDMLYSHQLSAITRAIYGQDYPIFNLADIWVVSGVILLLLNQSLVRIKRPTG